jgi:UDP-2,3-diacylglucosamine pyrophosphatase LpxH
LHHLVVVSDVHLCEGLPDAGPWMRWRQKTLFPDEEFIALVDALLGSLDSDKDSLELVFNGDLFDFDAGRVIEGDVRFEDLPRTEAVAVELLERVLNDHTGYVQALGRLLARGHRVVFISGNHDPQLTFPAVRERLRDRLVAAAGEGNASVETELRGRVLFRAWFHQSHGVHVEHGNQYDPYCSFRYPMSPADPSDRTIPPTVGSIAFRYLASRMGYFNPHVEETFMLGLTGYLSHWARNYLFTRRSLGATWVWGSAQVLLQTALHRARDTPERRREHLLAAARETGHREAVLEAHGDLFATPADETLLRVAREFWLDRMLLGAVCALALTSPWYAPRRLALPLAVGLPALFCVYELTMPAVGMENIYADIAAVAPRIAALYGLRGVVFGHTHQPYGYHQDGVFYGNSGSWGAEYPQTTEDPAEEGAQDPEGKPLVWLRTDAAGLRGGLYRWKAGALAPDTGLENVPRAFSQPPVPEAA